MTSGHKGGTENRRFSVPLLEVVWKLRPRRIGSVALVLVNFEECQ